MNTRTDVSRAARKAGDSRPLQWLARAGFAASGLLHLMLGYLAIQVAVQHSGQSDQSGALAQVASLPAGVVLLWLMTIGFFALALSLLAEAVVGVGSSSKKRWVRSLVPLGKAIAYIALGFTALTFAQGGSADASSSTASASADLLRMPGGQLLLGLVGALAFGVGVFLVVKGVRRKFEEDIVVPSGAAERPVVILGIVGYVAKGIAIAVVGILFVVAAVKVDASEATGLDGALKSLAELPFGVAILITVGVGLIAYGVYSFARARLARL